MAPKTTRDEELVIEALETYAKAMAQRDRGPTYAARTRAIAMQELAHDIRVGDATLLRRVALGSDATLVRES